ncbi:hypothetical protein LX97_00221 [Nonlabens dokdonensis]|uniref:Uncharacterized protein n=2 Tax=Nonlabens dokdonensis TaxID=328515 RepID=L7W1Z9_NONDD|nr:hypothetical protein [Nonlabens dokdonensis]AGC75525.1 hypothetical protein DDD_0398 [Nonlabens dokdonensis DSW-6]PZX43221.1 hypothetical protein LX97_00221 [Nonlabens dokdonensis]
MKKWGFILISILCLQSYGQELVSDELQGFNLFLMPAPQIEVTLSLDSNNIVNPNTGFSVTPGVSTVDMVAVYNESQLLKPKPFIPNSNTDYGRLRFKNDRGTTGVRFNNRNNFARQFRETNPAFFEANRNTAFQRSYNPLSCYNNVW